jgi:hypothetical protein
VLLAELILLGQLVEVPEELDLDRRAIERSPVSGRERRHAYAGLATWARRRSLVLADNVVDAVRVRNGRDTLN